MNNSSIFKHYEKYKCWRGDKQTILKNSIGRQLPYVVNFEKNLCKIFDIELERVAHWFSFPEGCQLIAVDYFPTAGGDLGIIVGVHDDRQSWGVENFIVALATEPNEPTMRVTYSLEVPSRITVVKTLFSHVDMQQGKRQGSLGLYHRLLEWKHIVAIGCKQSKCFLSQLTPVEPAAAQSVPIHDSKRSLMNLLAAFTKDGVLSYAYEDSCYRDYLVDSVYVSALALMPRSRTLLVGLSMGGILAASLNPSNNMQLLELRHERLIRHIAPLEPEDDPDKFEYFIAAVDRSPRHTVMIQLWRGSFKTLDQVDDSAKYDRPMYGVCLEHKMPYGERWLAVNPIVKERGDSSHRRREDSTMDSMLNVSQTFGSTLDRSHVLLAYERRKPSLLASEEPTLVVEAAIFDIDAWYYKRVPGRVSTDGTVLRQCAFMSCVASELPSEEINDIGILTLGTDDVSRFNSMVSDADQLFYPSALSYDRVFVAENSQILWMKIQSIQATILEACAAKLPLVMRSPDAMASNILAAGLVRKSILTGSPNSSAAEYNESELLTDQKVVLNAMVYYEKIDEFCALATRRELNDKFKNEIAQWAVHEAVDFKRTIADRTVSVFQGSSTALSPLACDTITQGIKLFRVVHGYLKVCAKNVKNGTRLNSLALSMKCMLNHTKLVNQFIGFHIVPVNNQVQQTMREMHEKRKVAAMKNRTALPVQLVVRNMHRLAPESQIWNEMPHDEWYPPTPIDLLESILNANVPERLKRELIVQYIVDYLRANPENAALDEKTLALKTITVMKNQVLDVDLAKIIYVLDQESAALKPKTAVVEDGVGTKVFSMQDDGVSYEKLFSGEVHLATIGKCELERFEERLKSQTEEAGRKKLKVLDPEAEMLYQVFLYERQKYQLMSKEAIDAIEQNAKVPFGLLLKTNGGRCDDKSAKQREIETSVKVMFEKQLANESADETPEVFASLADKHNGRKRKSDVFDEENGSPVLYVPPTAKRIQHKRIAPAADSPAPEETNVCSSLASPRDPETIADMNQLMATPARFYKRPMTAMSVNVDMLSPPVQRLPPVPVQNSILKTAKAVQSPSRGRIRFHESVRRGANETIDSSEETQDEPEPEQTPARRGIDFDILEDVEEEDVSRKSLLRETPVAAATTTSVAPIDDTFEIRSDDVPPPTDETFELSQSEPVERAELTFEAQEEVFEVLEDQVEPEVQPEVAEEVETMEDVLAETSEEVQEDAPEEIVQSEVVPETPQNAVEEIQEQIQETVQEEVQEQIQEAVQEEIQEQIQEAVQEEIQEAVQEEIQEEAQEPWDGIHRSFEVQKDEDIPLAAEQEMEDAELAEDIPIQEAVFEETAAQVESERPPSANTRLATAIRQANSRSATPIEQVPEVPKSSRKTRAASVQKTTELQEETTDSSRPPSRRTRAASVKKDTLPVVETEEPKKTPRKTRAASVKKDLEPEEEAQATVTRPRRASVSRSRAVSEVAEVEEKKTSVRTRTPSRSTTPSRTEEPKKTATRKTPARGRKASESVSPVEEPILFPEVVGSAVMRRASAKRAQSVRAASEVAAPPTTGRSVTRAVSVEPNTPKRGRPKKNAEETPVASTSAVKRRTPAHDNEEEPPKKARGRPRTTPLKVIPETDGEKPTDTPRRAGSRSRNNSTSSNAAVPVTPKRGRKAVLDNVEEESDGQEEAHESATPLRRSARRLQNQ